MHERPSAGLAITAGVLPVVVFPVAAALLTVLFGLEDAARLFREAGPAGLGIFGVGLVVTLIIAALLALTARGRNISGWVSIALALVPWLLGAAGMRLGMGRTVDAAAMVNAADKGIVLLAGFGESGSARVLGAWMSSALLAAIAIGLALGALARPAENRSLGGVIPALPALAIMALGVGLSPIAGARGMIAFVLPAVALGVAVAIAGWAAGREEGRPVSMLPFAAAVAGLLSVTAAGAMASASALRDAAEAGLMVDPASKAAVMAQGISEVVAVNVALGRAWVFAAFGGIALLVWSARRARPAKVGVAPIAIAVILMAGAPLLDLWTVRSTASHAADMAQPQWVRQAGLTLPTSDFSALPIDPSVIVRAGELRWVGGEALPLSGAGEQLAAKLRATYGPAGENALSVAADAALSANDLRALVRAAEASGADVLRLGTAGRVLRLPQAAASELKLLIQTLAGPAGLEVWLARSVEVPADSDPTLWHATLGKDAEVKPRAGAKYGAFPLEEPPPFRDGVVYLAMADGVTLQTVIDAAGKLTAAGFKPVLVAGEIPGSPERALGELAPAVGEAGPQ